MPASVARQYFGVLASNKKILIIVEMKTNAQNLITITSGGKDVGRKNILGIS